MSIITRYLKIISFALLVLVGIQLPGFVGAYRDNLEARMAESNIAIAPFQKTAERHFSGNLESLINHYANNKDSVLTDTSEGIQEIFQRNKLLKAALSNFKASQFDAYKETFLHPMADVQKQVWANYEYNVSLNSNAIIIGIGFALFFLVLMEIILWCLKSLVVPRKVAKA